MANLRDYGQYIGFLPSELANATTLALNAAATWSAKGFVVGSSLTLNTVRTYLSAKAGSPVAANWTLEIQGDTAGAPSGSILTGGGPVTQGSNPATGFFNFTGLSVALTAGTQYWIVEKNINGTPASNNWTMQYITNLSPFNIGAVGAKRGRAFQSSTNSGSTWTAVANLPNAMARLGFSDGSFQGLIYSNASAPTGANYQLFGTREIGSYMVMPSSLYANVLGLCGLLGNITGAPTGSPYLRLYRVGAPSSGIGALGGAATLLGSTFGTPSAGIPAGRIWLSDYLTTFSRVQIFPSDLLLVTFADSAGNTDSSSNYYRPWQFAADTDSDSLPLVPMGGNFGGVYVATGGDGVTFTTDTSNFYGVGLMLDTVGGEFNPGSVVLGEEGLRYQGYGPGW